MILCLGTTPAIGRTMSFDRVTLDGVNRAVNTRDVPAGKSLNAARVLHRLGHATLALGFLGGHSGQFIREQLDRAGIPQDWVIVESATRTCVTVIDQSAATATELVEEAAPVPAGAYAALLSKLNEKLKDAKGLIISGKLPPGAPPDFYARCVQAGTAANVLVILDATGEPLRRALASRPTIVKLNRSELEETIGVKIESEDSLKEAIRGMIQAGPLWVIVTGGAKDTVASDGKLFWRVSTPAVATISPIGSGDSFNAGLAAGITEGQTVPQACRLATACGAANAMTASPGEVHHGDITALAPRVIVAPF